MKKLKLFFALFAMLALGVGNAWGAEATLSSISTKNVVTTKGQSVSTTFGDVTCKVTRNSGNQPGFYTSSGIVRYYSEDVMTLSVPSGNTITKVVFTMNSGNVGTVDVGTVSSNTWIGNAESISFTGTGTVKITKIVVTYEATSGGQTPEPDPDPTPDPEPEPETGGEGTWTLVTNTSDLKAGDQIVIAATGSNYALGPQASNNRTAVAITKTGNNITWTTDVQIITLETGKVANTFAFNTGNTGYLYAVSSSDNYLRTKTTLDDNGSWAISITSAGVATIQAKGTNTRNLLKKNSQSALFSCYGSGQSDVAIYKKVTSSSTEEPVLSSIEISGDLENKTYEEGDELDLTGLTVQAIYESGDPKDVTKDVEWSYTPNPLTKGTTSVDVTATYEDKTATKTINGLAVKEHVITPGEYCITPNNTFWGTSYTGDDANEITNVSGKQNDVSVLMTKSGQYGYINASQTRVYANYTMLFSVPAGYAITKIVFTADGSNWKGTHTADVGEMTDSKTWTGANQNVTITFGGTCRITNICVTYEELDLTLPSAPTFNPEAGTYNAVQNVTISAEAGTTIYYTLDGTDPDSESTKYTTPIILDECGEHTIKAIAISSDSESPVASATYEIQLPILANSAVDPYTEAEAIDVYNSGCYDGEELVYVTGTVQTAQFYNSGTYTITLTGGMQFYYFYEGADEDVFESDYINEGDDIVACGKLSMYNTIYQLAKGCYLVKHKPVAQLSWSKSTCTAEIGGTNEFPTLTNTNSVAVSYSSSNTAAATINETTGEIALVAAGETTITATFAGNENYKANSASYTLTVAEAVVRGTITYNTNGGTEVAAQENQTNLPETLPTTTKAGYNFGGWYTDAECNTPAVANSVLTGDITLHAKWLEPYTVAQALAMNVTTGVYVKGIISTITEVNTDYKNATYKISDDGTTTSEMIVYRGKNVDNTDFTSEDQIAVGDIVVIYGNLSEYNSAIQLAQGNYIYSLTEPTLYTVTISFETNGGEPVESIEANTLPDPFPTTTKEGHAFDGWYMDNALTIPAVAGTPITTDADITLYAKWTEVSKWATTYTSNIEVGSDEVIINETEYEAKKTGTSSAYGSTSVVVPVSTHTLHFHAAGWGADNLVNLVVKNGETVLGTFELSKDAGVKSNSPYTLAGTPYQQYYSVSLTNITAETTITFEASTSGGKRFVLYGVNQEGGIVPELNRIEIIGEATELTYEIGDVFNPAGLGVNAIYTLAGVDHETVAIDAEDVEWSFNPATIAAETSQVEVTATYMEKTATKTVADLTVNVPTPEITATPASIDWGTVNKDSEASKEVSVTLKAVANATISISGTNPSTFSVDKTALTETGTIVVSANTSSVGTFTATLTISDDAAAAEEKKISLKIIVEGIDDVYGNWQLVTDASTLKAGDMVIVASVEVEGKYYTMGKQNSNNRAAIESTVSETQLTPTTGTSVLTLVDAGDGKFAFQASNGKYLSAAGTGDNNYLREAENYDSDKTKWTISVTAEGVATIKATSDNRNWMRYNKSSIIFSCYGSGQTDIALYKRVPDYTRTTSAGRYGTICLPGNIVKCLGATLYEVAGKEGSRVVFDEVLTPKAGMPYIFLAHNAEVLFYCGDQTAAAGNHNSLYGTFTVLQNSELEGKYMVQNNKIVKCNPANSGVAENRAYFNGEELEDLRSAPAPMPGRKRITMGRESENTATGTEDVVAPAGQTLKLIENGQLVIIRNGEKFNAQGMRL